MSPERPVRVEHPIEMISAYMDGRLEAVDRTRVHDHLGQCTPCQSILADFRALAAAARREAAPPIPTYLLERIGRRIDTEAEARPAPPLRFLLRARLPLATAAAVLVMASLWVILRGRLPGERLAESRPNAAPPISKPSTERAQPSRPEPAPVPPAGPGEAGQETDYAPSPPAARPTVTVAPPIKKDKAAVGGTIAEREENKMSGVPSQQAIPAPEENLDRAEPTTGVLQGLAGPEAQDVAPPMAGPAKSAGSVGTTLVFILAEARVSLLPDLGVVLTAGDYICSLPAGGAEEVRALAELRGYAVARRRSADSGQAETRPAGRDSQESRVPREMVIPAPPASGPLPPDVAAETHRRVLILLHDSLLARAEAQCGPAPPSLHPER